MKVQHSMDEGFYQDLFKHFCSVAYRVAPDIAIDKDLCRDIFHQRVLFPKKIGDMGEAVDRIRGKGLAFASPKAYSNWLYTVFKHAILEYLRKMKKDKERIITVEESTLDILADPHPGTPGESQSYLIERAKGLKNKFSREERRLLALRYIANKTMEEVGQFLDISTSTVSRREQKVKEKLAQALCLDVAELEEKDQLCLLEAFLSYIDLEGKDNEYEQS